MFQEHQFVSKDVTCPKGHQIKLEMLSGTPNMIRAIECPACGTRMIVFAGHIRGVVPIGSVTS
jgi:hypothetical protein